MRHIAPMPECFWRDHFSWLRCRLPKQRDKRGAGIMAVFEAEVPRLHVFVVLCERVAE